MLLDLKDRIQRLATKQTESEDSFYLEKVESMEEFEELEKSLSDSNSLRKKMVCGFNAGLFT